MAEKIIAFNWKMNPKTLKEALALAKISDFENAVIAPPFVFIEEIEKILKKAKLGAQNIFYEPKGAFTGEISAGELKKLGVKYVIIGHSERRQILGETDEIINKKILIALKAGLKVILCVGEPFAIRKKGKKAVENFIKSQLRKDLKKITKPHILNPNRLIIAYEPVWAIGTGNYCKSEDAAKMIKFIKQTLVTNGYTLNPKVLYGGSVNSKNIKNFIKCDEIDGFLIGGASLKLKEIKSIIKKMNHEA